MNLLTRALTTSDLESELYELATPRDVFVEAVTYALRLVDRAWVLRAELRDWVVLPLTHDANVGVDRPAQCSHESDSGSPSGM